MIVALGCSLHSLALTHLLFHAFFKSLLFLASGSILHSLSDNQDIRKMGSLIFFTPLTYTLFLFGSLSLMAFPFTAGFYSKDLLLEILVIPHSFSHSFAYLFTLFAAFLTNLYSLNSFIIVFFSRPLFSPSSLHSSLHDSGSFMNFPMLFISFGAIFLGYLSHDFMLGFGSEFYSNSLFTHPSNFRFLDSFNSHSLFTFLPLLFLFFFFSILLFFSPLNFSYPSSSSLPSSSLHFSFFSHSPHLNRFGILNKFNNLNNSLKSLSLSSSLFILRYIDKGSLEFFGPLGLGRLFHYLGFLIELLSTGFILHYSYIFLSILLLTSLFFFL